MNELNNYCLYYIPKSNDTVSDTLMIYFGENKIVNKRILKEEIIYLLSNNDIVGYALMNFSKLCKIKANGTLFLPNEFLIKIINDYLHQNKIEITLKDKAESGFVVGRIISSSPLDKSYLYEVDIKSKIIKVESTFEIANSTLVVVALNGTYLMPGRMVNEYKNKDLNLGNRICTFEDLQMDVSNAFLPLLIMEDDLEVGQDFFMTEEKIYA